MKMTEEIFELLIGKYLDGEITPSEERLLEAELERNPKAAELASFKRLAVTTGS